MSAIYKKMNEVMKDIGSISKDQKNVAQGFKFRGIDQFVNALYPALVKHGVFMVPACQYATHEIKDVTRSNGKAGVDKHVSIQMKYTFYAEDGSNVVVGPVPAEGLDSGDKATNKALSAALKYALIQTFSIPTQDMEEGDATSPTLGANVATTVVSEVLANVKPISNNTATLNKAVKTTFKKPSNNGVANGVSNVAASASDDVFGA